MKENKKEQEQKTVIEMAELKFGKEKLAELKAQFPGRKLNIIVVEHAFVYRSRSWIRCSIEVYHE